MDKLKDERVNCYSVMTQLTIGQYLRIIQSVYESGGGIEGQRESLKTSTAIRIRKRMIEDLRLGTVLPPIVLGVVVEEEVFNNLDNLDEKSFFEIIDNLPKENISIIDGMQRTTAMTEVISNSKEDLSSRKMRVEYWVAPTTNSLIYRMLVLNTGQVPWNLRRQLETVFRSMIKEINKKVDSVEVLEVNDAKRRSRAGQFQADQVIELFLVFGARKEKIDTKERLADEFTKQDFIEATSDDQFTSMFYDVLGYLAKFDKLFDKYKNSNDDEQEGRFQSGKDLFSSQPARVGFVTAIALKVLGRPGTQYSENKQKNNLDTVKNNAEILINKLDLMDSFDIENFLDFNTLNEVIFHKSGRVGDFEREFFLKAFNVLIEDNFNITAMTPCWRAY
ncbi:MAG: hypothetical protein ACYTXE_30690 [Nostoc sp.]